MASLELPETYRVGGSVRDEVLDRPSNDSDYVVRGASIDEIRDALAAAGAGAKALRLRDGRQVGVRAEVRGLGLVEIVLPRKEVTTGKGHRDFRIVCDPSLTLAEDAERRDFTMNALYRNVRSGEVLDPLGGLDDIARRQIRTTHPDSFRDDPLRTLRALRFVSQLRFDLVAGTYAEMQVHAEHVTALTLRGVSGTALLELEKLLAGPAVGYAMRLMRDSGVLTVLLPELASMAGFEQRSAYHDKTLDEHAFDTLQAAADLNASPRVRMALLFHDAGKPWMAWAGDNGRLHYYAISPTQAAKAGTPTAVYSHEWWGAFLADSALDRLNAPRDTRRDVRTLIERHMLSLARVRSVKLHTWRAELGDNLLRDLIQHRRCDVLGKGGEIADALQALDLLDAQLQDAIDAGVPRSTKQLALTGAEIAALGFKGPAIGDIQRQLLHAVMADPSRNDRDWLLERARRLPAA
jgi:tRNA nucleotidyltransferase (CCA-adding enzyme)